MVKLKLYTLQEKLAQLKKTVFTPQDIKLLFAATSRAVNGFLTYNSQQGKIIKLKKGLYVFKNNYVTPYIIANNAYKPSYISFETALSYYHIIPETIYSIISATSKVSRQWEMDGKTYLYRKLKQNAFTGYVTKLIEGEQVLIATPEKALVDYCYFVYLGKIKELNNRLDLKNIQLVRLKNYLKLFNHNKLTDFVNKCFNI